jgi:hypothetical protein
MKCKQVLQRLLATSGPRTVPAEVLAHLEGCERCRGWSTRLRQIDAAVPMLPVPDSGEAKAALVRKFLAPPTPLAEPVWTRRRLRVNWARVLVVSAAALMLILAVTGVFNRERSRAAATPQDALLARVLDRQLELANAGTTDKRVEALDHLAGELDAGALSLALVAARDDLDTLATLYVAVVSGEKGLVARADDVPLAVRKELLTKIVRRLKTVTDNADRTAREVPPDAVAALKRIAATARDAHDKLQRKIEEEKVAQDVTPRIGESKS